MIQKKPILIFLTLFLSVAAFSQERVVFSSFSPESWEIYLSKDGGETFQSLTDHAALDYDAVISPDEKWVVFTSERNGLPQLYVMPLDGSAEPRPLIESESFQDQASFSPDGSKLAFVASHEGNAEIYLMDFTPDSIQQINQARNLTHHSGGDFRPSFSPDGDYLVFSSDRAHPIQSHPVFPFAMDRKGDIYKLHLKTEKLERLTQAAFWDGSPQWSGDGKYIFFYSGRNGNQPAIFRMNTDGSQIKQVSDSTHLAVSPVPISNSQFAYTTLDQPNDRVYNLVHDFMTGQNDTLYLGELDLFNLHRSKSGIWVAHGGKTAQEMEQNKGGFSGKLIGAGFPRVFQKDSMQLELTAVRRAFAAPPDPDGPFLMFDYIDQSDPMKFFMDGATIWIWPALLLILSGVWMVFRGVYLSIRNRKRIPVWRFLLASLGILFSLLLVVGLFLNFFLINMSTFDYLLPTGIVTAFILGFLAIWSYRKNSRFSAQKNAVSRIYFYLFSGLLLMCVLMGYLGLFAANLIQPRAKFYRVNYQTMETEKIYELEPNYGVHPAYSSVIDLKYIPDGSGLLVTTGPFRGDKGSKATVWQYDFEKKSQSKLTDSDWNNGFADYSLTKETMVFRSDRDGNMDIFVLEGGELKNLTSSLDRENFPVISPDGNKIVFVSDRNGKEVGEGIKTMDLYLINRQGDGWSSPEQLTFSKSQTGHPHFSPDGEWIIYTTEEYGINDEQPLFQSFIFSPQMYGEIVALRLSDRKKIKITHNKWEEGAPLWVKGLE